MKKMINNKWYKVSLFIPFWGTLINLFILYIELIKKRFSYWTLVKLMFGTGIPFGFLFIFGQALSFKIYESEHTWITVLAFIIAGYLMNLLFKLMYEKHLKKGCK